MSSSNSTTSKSSTSRGALSSTSAIAIKMESAATAELNQTIDRRTKLNTKRQLVISSDAQSMEKIFDCPRCSRKCSIQNVIVLQDCGHLICKECIADDYFKYQKFQMKCELQSEDLPICGSRINKSEIELVLDEIGVLKDWLEVDKLVRKDIEDEAQDDTRKANVIRNEINFWCGICSLDCPVGNGLELQNCSHHVCKNCLRDAIKKNCDRDIRCPYSKSYVKCEGLLVDIEIESLTSTEEFQQFKMLAIKEPTELFQLMKMDKLDYIKNCDEFDCPICFTRCKAGEGIKLRDCFHQFCLECFTDTVVHSEDPLIKCPFTDENLSHCESVYQEREIKAVVSKEIYEKFLERKLKFAEHAIENTFHCQTVDCVGFGIIESDDSVMICVICHQINCLKCEAIHKNQTCVEYQDQMTKDDDNATERFINDLKSLGDVMNCPKCAALIGKISGCSWVQCRFCAMEICWVTKGPRWGVLGKGDNSGGCKCRLDGNLCHPSCTNCH